MKKYNVFKVLLCALLATIIVSFLIPQSTLGYSSGIEKGIINPITLVDSISNGLTSFSVFISTFVYILSIGVFYAVLKKTGKYEDVINNTACKFKNRKGLFLVISILMFGLLTAITGEMMTMLVMAPAFIDIAKKLGYDSKKAILITIGAILMGSSASLYTNYANQVLQTTVSTNIIAKVLLLIISLGSLIAFALLGKKAEEVKLEKVEIKKGVPTVISFDIILFFIIIGMVPWNGYFGFDGFEKFHETVTGISLFDVSVFNAIIGTTLSAFGSFTLYTMTAIIVIVSVILSLIYKLKIDGLFESVAKGIRVALPYAIILILSNTILVGVYNSGFFITVTSSIAKMSDKIISASTLSALSSVVYPDYSYATQFTLSTITYVITNAKVYAILALIFQAMYSLFLLISPTSILLLMGLHFKSVNYKDWIKYIYKYLLALLITFLVVIMIVGKKYVTTISFIVLAVIIIMFVLLMILTRNKKTKTKVKTKNEKKETKKSKKENKKNVSNKKEKKSKNKRK